MVVLLYGLFDTQQRSLIVPAVKAKLVQQADAGFAYQQSALEIRVLHRRMPFSTSLLASMT